jgi:hypothetical protein
MAEEGTPCEADVQSKGGLGEETECGERRYAYRDIAARDRVADGMRKGGLPERPPRIFTRPPC